MEIGMLRIFAAAATLAVLYATGASAAANMSKAGVCGNIQAKCAIEVGGTCNPQTGAWSYDNNTPGFMDCLMREQKKDQAPRQQSQSSLRH